ncbi:hypothetical protein RO3G_09354 [Lichtheimia corymbifera JMRC:FSU:9682]|uniref:Protein phosphatase 1 regulatory subunit 21 N-terminal domain-containing protein n=1 Tax=Lichtheimia corymbifera JMRC:FSU:9682 TaxID=1263082 RepID=A0A068S859_9FUNG|nr:hypothetical protein RO3G_09354 [Lichtheimia corymbifera JMRC:FSU:9682]
MNDGLLAKHAHMNTAAIPPSAEDLAQKHQSLLQEYSRLKAKHTVLKKAALKEQANKALLQNNVKEKEKELRKLQEQLDLLSFHNERLTKRIDAVQGNEQKGSHFSLLGGAVKKELERSTQALDAMNVDLAKKIEENERLHDELSENHHIYTDHVNGLHLTIAKLEKRVEELQVEISTIQKDSREKATALKKEKETLQSQVDSLKKDIKDKTITLKENEQTMVQGDKELRSEIESLRAILLAKAGDIEGREDEDEGLPKLADVIPACDALKILEEQAKNYIYALREQTALKGLPHEIAAKLKTSSETWSEQVQNLAKRLEESEARVKELLDASQGEKAESSDQIASLQKNIEDLKEELNQRHTLEQTEQLEKANRELEQRNKELDERNAELEGIIKKQETDLTDVRRQLEESLEMNKTLQKDLVDKETQANIVTPAAADAAPKDTSEDEDDGVFVYRSNETTNTQQPQEEEEEEDDEVFVYRGQDAPEEPTASEEQQQQQQQQPNTPSATQATFEEKCTQTDQHPQDEKQTQTDTTGQQQHQDEKQTQTDEQPIHHDVKETQTDKEQLPDYLDEQTQTDQMASLDEKQTQTEKRNTTDTATDALPPPPSAPAATESVDVDAQQAAMEAYYESQLKQLNEKLEMADSKALRFSQMVQALKERLSSEGEQRSHLEQENERLQKEVDRVKEHLETTEKNYQDQIAMMTENFLTQLNDLQQQQQPPIPR